MGCRVKQERGLGYRDWSRETGVQGRIWLALRARHRERGLPPIFWRTPWQPDTRSCHPAPENRWQSPAPWQEQEAPGMQG